jgi:hypothetical protein
MSVLVRGHRAVMAVLSLAVLACFSPLHLFASTVVVGTCKNLVQFATIQAAINASPSGSTVDVCPGTYPEQLTIAKSITLTGVAFGTSDAAIIVPPGTGLVQNATDVDTGNPIAAQIFVQNPATSVTISNLTVDGTGNAIAGCGPDLQGILYQNVSGTINHVAVRNQTLGAGLGGCQSGEGIYVQTGAGFTSTVTVENSSVHNYNKNGITANDSDTTLTAELDYVQGAGVVPSGGAAQNGIQLGFGAKGTIKNNTVIDNIYGDPTIAASADILLYDTAENSSISIATNTLGNSQLPIALYTLGDDGANLGDGVSVTGNKILGTSVYDAIDVCTNGNTVTGNIIFNSAESGVHLDASCGAYFGGSTGNNNTATGNTILESACAGILADPGTTGNNTTTPVDTYFTVPFTITSSTSSCTIPPGAPIRAKGARKVSPRR